VIIVPIVLVHDRQVVTMVVSVYNNPTHKIPIKKSSRFIYRIYYKY